MGIGFIALVGAVKGTKGTIGIAYVGVVQVGIYDEGHLRVRNVPVPPHLGQGSQVEGVGVL